MKVLFVCTGNLCRSPMAEALLKHALRERGCDDVEVASVGTWALEGAPATKQVESVLGSAGVQLGNHRSRALTRDEVRAADLIVAMTSVHRKEILEQVPEAENKVFLAKELAEVELQADADGLLEQLRAAKRPRWTRSMDVDDPMGLPLSAYRRCLRDLGTVVEVLADLLCGRERRGPVQARE